MYIYAVCWFHREYGTVAWRELKRESPVTTLEQITEIQKAEEGNWISLGKPISFFLLRQE
jgi:hypothetical protein